MPEGLSVGRFEGMAKKSVFLQNIQIILSAGSSRTHFRKSCVKGWEKARTQEVLCCFYFLLFTSPFLFITLNFKSIISL